MFECATFFTVIFIAIMMYYMYANLSSSITQLKWDIQNVIYGAEERLAKEIFVNTEKIEKIEKKIDKINIKAIEEKEVDIKTGDEIVDENDDFYFVTYVYGDRVDGISKDGVVREGMEMKKVRKTGKKAQILIKEKNE